MVERDQYKLNVHRPGFSRPLPPGAAALSDPYIIENKQDATVHVQCFRGGEGNIAPLSTGNLTCLNVCGIFSGADFYGTGWRGAFLCDYKNWGVDVVNEFIDQVGNFGMHCTEPC